MKVLLNAVSAKMGGAANCIRNIASEFERVVPKDEFIIVLPANQARAIKRTAPNIRIITAPNGGLLRRVWFDLVSYAGCFGGSGSMCCTRPRTWECSRVPVRKFYQCEIPCIFASVLQHILARMVLWAQLTNWLRRRLVCRSVEWAEVVVTPSESMMQDLHAYVNQPASKFHVIPYSTMLERFQRQDSCDPQDARFACCTSRITPITRT